TSVGRAPGAGAQQPLVLDAAPPAHGGEADRGLQRSDQNGARASNAFAHEVDAPMDTVGAVNVSVSGGPKHHRVALGLSAVTVCGRIGVMIGLDFDDHAPDAVEEEARSDQFARDLVNAASEKTPVQSFL